MASQIIMELMRELASGAIAAQVAAGHDPVSPVKGALVWAILLQLAPEFAATGSTLKLPWSCSYGIEYCKWKIIHDREMEDESAGSTSGDDESEAESGAEFDADAEADAEAVVPAAAHVDVNN